MRHFLIHPRALILSFGLIAATPLLGSNVVQAQSAVAPDDDFDDEAYRVDFPATILRSLSQNRIEVRGGNGHLYKVEYAQESQRFEVGRAVRVLGFANGLDVEDAVLIVDGRATATDNSTRFQAPKEVDFPAEFTGIDKKRGRATVRGEDGNTYHLRGDEVEDFEVGDRVRVQGVSRYGVVELRTLEIID
ncbi:hypothetical protein EON80_12930 [bacterium]|nr:MAG: hypothetical protein EON80_12930 [bacterium]